MAAAIITPKSRLLPGTFSVKRAMPIGKVIIESLFRITRGHKKLFQDPRKVMTARVPIAGRVNGKMIFKKMRNSEHPSIRAESSSSSGIEPINCFIKKMPKAGAMKGKINPA